MCTCIKRRITATVMTRIREGVLWYFKDVQNFAKESFNEDPTDAEPLWFICWALVICWFTSFKLGNLLDMFASLALSETHFSVLPCSFNIIWPFGIKFDGRLTAELQYRILKSNILKLNIIQKQACKITSINSVARSY